MIFLLYIPILFFSVVLHEYMHGYVAYRCGDDTAYLMGRLTFNPIAHIDVMGTIIVPALCYFSGLPPFGWAKPVPVNFYRLNDPKRDMGKVALAGPASNILLIIIGAVILKFFVALHINAGIFAMALLALISVNLVLTIFNLLPIPPLDGSKIMAALLPRELSARYMQLERYSFLIIVIMLSTRIFNYIITPIFNFIFGIILKFTGAGYGGF
jgi:Zn-dependent protease